jgi:hypothetical protein
MFLLIVAVLLPLVYYGHERKQNEEEKIANKREIIHAAETSVT